MKKGKMEATGSLDSSPTKRLKKTNSLEEDTLQAALDAAKQQNASAARDAEKASREEFRAAREEAIVLRDEGKVIRKESVPSPLEHATNLKERGRAWREKHGFNSDNPRKMSAKMVLNTRRTITPMIYACIVGDLDMCRIHFNDGAEEDIRTVADNGSTPMAFACEGGHLEVGQWLFEVGADGDITKTNKYGPSQPTTCCLC